MDALALWGGGGGGWGGGGTYDVESDSNRPFIPPGETDSLIPRVLELKIRSPTLPLRPQRSPEVVRVPFFRPFLGRRRLVGDRARSRDARVAQRRPAGHEHGVVHVPRV